MAHNRNNCRELIFKRQWDATNSLYTFNDAINLEHDIRQASGLTGTYELYDGPATTYGGDCFGHVEPTPSEYAVSQGFEHMRGVGVSGTSRGGSGDEATDEKRALGMSLRKMRERAGLKSKDLASLVGCGVSHVSAVEYGRSTVSESYLRRVKDACGVSS